MTYHLRLEHVMTIDLQEATRRDDVYRDLNEIVDKITVLPVFPLINFGKMQTALA